MGLFGKKEKCSICGKEKTTKILADGYACQECIDKCGSCLFTVSWKTVTVQRVKDAIFDEKINQERKGLFQQTQMIEKILILDEIHRLWKIKAYSNLYFSYDDIVGYECVKNGGSVYKIDVGGAVLGGAIFGEVGAILGGLSGAREKEEIDEFKIVINTNNKSYPVMTINLLPSGKIKVNSLLYKTYSETAEKIINKLNEISVQKNEKIEHVTQEPVADELLKFKKLLNIGAISQEEYDVKKKQLLGL